MFTKKSDSPRDYNQFSKLRAKCKRLSKLNYQVFIEETEYCLTISRMTYEA